MALPKIVFHNVTNGLTAEIILSEEIDKNAIIEIPSDDSSSVTDGSGNKLIKLTTHEQMKRLLNQMTTDFNNIFSTMRRELTNQFQNINSAISNEASQRLEQDRNIMNSLNTEIQNRQSADSQLQRNIDSEASTRQSKDSDLQRQLDEKVPVGTIIPVIKSINGKEISTPSSVLNNYLLCDGSIIPSSSRYSALRNALQPSVGNAYNSNLNFREFIKGKLSLYSSNYPNNFGMSLNDFNKLIKDVDVREIFYTHMVPFGWFISIEYIADIYSISLLLEYLGVFNRDNSLAGRVIVNEESYGASGSFERNTNNIGRTYGNKRTFTGSTALYIQIQDKTTNKIVHEHIVICNLRAIDTTNTSTEYVGDSVLYSKIGNLGITSFESFSASRGWQRVCSFTSSKGYQYLGICVTEVPLDTVIGDVINGNTRGYMSNRIEMFATPGDYLTNMSSSDTTPNYSLFLGRFAMTIEDYCKFTKIDAETFRNNFYKFAKKVTFPSNKRRQWLAIRPNGKVSTHDYEYYFPWVMGNDGFGWRNSSGYSWFATQVRDSAISYIRLVNRSTGRVELEWIYVSMDNNTTYDAGDTAGITNPYRSFKLNNGLGELVLNDHNTFGKDVRDVEIYKLPYNHLFIATNSFKPVYKVVTQQLGSALPPLLASTYRYKYNYDYNGGDYTPPGSDYSMYGGIGRYSMSYSDWLDWYWVPIARNAYNGSEVVNIARPVALPSSSSYRVFSSDLCSSLNRYIVRCSGFNKLEVYWMNSSNVWSTRTISTSLSGKVFKIAANNGLGTIVCDFRNNNMTSTSTTYQHNNGWSDGLIVKQYPEFKHPNVVCSDFTLIDKSVSGKDVTIEAFQYSSTTNVQFYYLDYEEENTTNTCRLPNYTDNVHILASDSLDKVGSKMNTKLEVSELYDIERLPNQSSVTNRWDSDVYGKRYIHLAIVEYWIKF